MEFRNEGLSPTGGLFEGIHPYTLKEMGISISDKKIDNISEKTFEAIQKLKEKGDLSQRHIDAARLILERQYKSKAGRTFEQLISAAGKTSASEQRYLDRMNVLIGFESVLPRLGPQDLPQLKETEIKPEVIPFLPLASLKEPAKGPGNLPKLWLIEIRERLAPLGEHFQGETTQKQLINKFLGKPGIHDIIFEDKENQGRLTYLKIKIQENGKIETKTVVSQSRSTASVDYIINEILSIVDKNFEH